MLKLTLATLWHPLEAPDMCLFPMLILGSLFATNHGTTGPHLFLRQALRLKKTAESTQRTKEPGPGRSGPGFPGRLPWRSPKASRILASRVSSCHRYHGLSGVKVSGF